MANPFGLTIVQDRIYWVDNSLEQILYTRKEPNNRTEQAGVIRRGVDNLKDIAMFDKNVQPNDGMCLQLSYWLYNIKLK